MTRAARRKAQSAQEKVRSAEGELVAANEALQQAIPRRDVEAIASAAERTAHAEDEVRDAAHELEAVNELLADGTAPDGPPRQGASGEGVRSLLPYLRKAR